MFVVVSIGSRVVKGSFVDQPRIFVTPIIIHLAVVLLACAVVLVPSMTRLRFGAVAGVAGIVFLAYAVRNAFHIHRRDEVEWSDHLWCAASPVAAYLIMIAGAVMVLRSDRGMIEAIGLPPALLVIGGIRNAWDLILFFPRAAKHRRDPAAALTLAESPSSCAAISPIVGGLIWAGAIPSNSFQALILKLQSFWAEQGCVILQPYDVEMGAGTFHPATTLRALGPKPWKAAYVQPSRRPTDGRYGENPNRLQHYYQFQVIMKPAPADSQALYLKSLAALGIDMKRHDIRFVEDDWESPTLGAWGLGWEVWLDGMEVTQFTYFQQVGGIECDPVSTELAYGLERLAMYGAGRRERLRPRL